MLSLVSHTLSLVTYVVLKKIIFSFSVLTVSFGIGLWLKPLWTRSWLGLDSPGLGLDKGGLDYSPTSPYRWNSAQLNKTGWVLIKMYKNKYFCEMCTRKKARSRTFHMQFKNGHTDIAAEDYYFVEQNWGTTGAPSGSHRCPTFSYSFWVKPHVSWKRCATGFEIRFLLFGGCVKNVSPISINVYKPHSITFIHSFIHAFSQRFYPKRLTVHSGYTCIVSMCVPWNWTHNLCAANAMLYHWY